MKRKWIWLVPFFLCAVGFGQSIKIGGESGYSLALVNAICAFYSAKYFLRKGDPEI